MEELEMLEAKISIISYKPSSIKKAAGNVKKYCKANGIEIKKMEEIKSYPKSNPCGIHGVGTDAAMQDLHLYGPLKNLEGLVCSQATIEGIYMKPVLFVNR